MGCSVEIGPGQDPEARSSAWRGLADLSVAPYLPVNRSRPRIVTDLVVLASCRPTPPTRPTSLLAAFADGALDPIDFPVAPALKAIPNALKRANLQASDIALWEINEVGVARVA